MNERLKLYMLGHVTKCVGDWLFLILALFVEVINEGLNSPATAVGSHDYTCIGDWLFCIVCGSN